MENDDNVVAEITILEKDLQDYNPIEKVRLHQKNERVAVGIGFEGDIFKFTYSCVPVIENPLEIIGLILDPKDEKEKLIAKQYCMGIMQANYKYVAEHGGDEMALFNKLNQKGKDVLFGYETISEYKKEYKDGTIRSVIPCESAEESKKRDRKFYVLDLVNNSDNNCGYDKSGKALYCTFGNIIEKKYGDGFFAKYYKTPAYIIAECVDGTMIDVLLSEAIKYNPKENIIYDISYKSAHEVSKSFVVDCLSELSSEDIVRYKEAMYRVKVLTDKRYYDDILKEAEKLKKDKQEALEKKEKEYRYNEGFDDFMNNFKKRCRKDNN